MSIYEEYDDYLFGPVQDAWPLDERIGAYQLLHPTPERSKQSHTISWEAAQLEGIDNLSRYTSPYTSKLYKGLTEYSDDTDTPDLTVTIPVAVNHEEPERIASACEQIEKAAKYLRKVEVLVWANAKYKFIDFDTTVENKRRTYASADKSYAVLQDLLGRRRSNVRYVSGLQIDQSSKMRMSDIRFSYMSVLLARARKRNYPASHPVMWVDADTTFMSRQTFSNMIQLLGKVPFAHPTVHFSAEWSSFPPRTDTERGFILDEIIERNWLKTHVPTLDNAYPEESGMTFTLDTYLKANGVNTKASMNEAGSLISRYYQRQSVSFDPETTPKDCLAYDPTTKITLSGRRAISLVRNHGSVGLGAFRESAFGSYCLWCDMNSSQQTCSERQLSAQGILNIHRNKLSAMTDTQSKRMEQLAARLWRY